MAKRTSLGQTKITDGWKMQFVVDARKAMEMRDGEKLEEGDRIEFFLEPDGRIVIERVE